MESTAARTHTQATHSKRRSARILVAEDDREMRMLIASMLRGEGHDVVEAGSGLVALDVLGAAIATTGRRRPFDLIVSDVRMPGRTGIEILAGLRRNDWMTPVVLITAFGDDELHERCYRLGADLVLDKPLDFDELLFVTRALTSVPDRA